MKVTFRGAVGTVTGSMHEVCVDGKRILLDCGLFQGRRKEARERNSHLPFPGDSVDSVILSHAHIDHSGNLPSLVKSGFSGPIYATPATVDLCEAMLQDSGHIHEKDAEFLNRRLARGRRIDPTSTGPVIEPLYTKQDAVDTMPLFRQVGYRTPTQVSETLSYEAYDAGHMLGSSSVLLTEKTSDGVMRLAFSGDVGRPGLPIIRDPQPLPDGIDYLIIESTYGGRLHREGGAVKDQLADVVKRTAERGGNVIVPAFAVGRTQQLVLLLHELTLENLIPTLPIFVDSPLATNVTKVFRDHPECYDEQAREFLEDEKDPFAFGRLRYTRSVEESKALNDLRYPFIVISASGMCEAGRILHHLKNHIADPRNTVLITGYQAQYTLGRRMLERKYEVPIFGRPVRLRADVEKLNELSGHADQRELLQWMEPFAAGLKGVFLVHGEPAQSRAFQKAIKDRFGVNAVLPTAGQSFDLS
jgi:metallo-beta-lactamase family protein